MVASILLHVAVAYLLLPLMSVVVGANRCVPYNGGAVSICKGSNWQLHGVASTVDDWCSITSIGNLKFHVY
ncbi:hypothetical protein QBC34DRAFT_411382, partial [Podospora aff. communis PSN243]